LVAEGAPSPPGIEEVSNSWLRSAKKYGIDPVDSSPPRILTDNELKDFREPADKLIFSAQEEMDQLYKVVREAGYAVLFCDTAGVAVEHRGENAHASQFEYWGTWLGGVWSESAEGTNGIGTCIVEERPVTVHRGQHYRSRHINLSCSGAPIFDVDGRLIAVLDVSAIDPERSERAHALTGALTVASARAIEERFFREQFRREWIVAVAPPEEGAAAMLLAVDDNRGDAWAETDRALLPGRTAIRYASRVAGWISSVEIRRPVGTRVGVIGFGGVTQTALSAAAERNGRPGGPAHQLQETTAFGSSDGVSSHGVLRGATDRCATREPWAAPGPARVDRQSPRGRRICRTRKTHFRDSLQEARCHESAADGAVRPGAATGWPGAGPRQLLPPAALMSWAARRHSSGVALENWDQRPAVPPSAQSSGVRPCLLR